MFTYTHYIIRVEAVWTVTQCTERKKENYINIVTDAEIALARLAGNVHVV